MHKKQIVEEMEKKMETLKRRVEENTLEEIENVLNRGTDIYSDLHSNYEESVQEVFDLQKKEEDLIRELNEINKEVNHLTTEKLLFKKDTQGGKTQRENRITDIEIRKTNRVKNKDFAKSEDLPVDCVEFEKWKKKTEIVDEELEKYLGIYLELGKVTNFGEEQFECTSRVNNIIGENEGISGSLMNEKTLMKKSEEDIQNKVQSIEEWLNLMITIQKKNVLGGKSGVRLEMSPQKTPEKKRRNSRRTSRRMSKLELNRRSFVSTQSMPRRVVKIFFL